MNPPERRNYGTGSLLIHMGAGGKETWYGRWCVGKKRVKRRIGPKRKPGGRTGLSRTQAEAELRRLMVAERAPLDGDELSLTEAAEHMLRHLEALERKPTTLENYRSLLRTHLAPRLGEIPIDQVTSRQVEELATQMRHEGKAAKTARTHSSCCRRSSPSPSAGAGVARIPASWSAAPRSSRAPTSTS